jgi:hypothetical protein
MLVFHRVFHVDANLIICSRCCMCSIFWMAWHVLNWEICWSRGMRAINMGNQWRFRSLGGFHRLSFDTCYKKRSLFMFFYMVKILSNFQIIKRFNSLRKIILHELEYPWPNSCWKMPKCGYPHPKESQTRNVRVFSRLLGWHKFTSSILKQLCVSLKVKWHMHMGFQIWMVSRLPLGNNSFLTCVCF